MSSGLDLTYDFLANTRNVASIDVLVDTFDCGQSADRSRCIRSMVERDTQESFARILDLWESLSHEEQQLVGEASRKLDDYLSSLIGDSESARWFSAVEMAQRLSRYATLAALIEKAEKSADLRIQSRALAVVLDLASQLGRSKRDQRSRSRYRLPTVERLMKSVHSIEFHRQEALVDAFLSVALWSDASLQTLLAPESDSAERIAARLMTSTNPAVIDLLAGWITKARLPSHVIDVLKRRQDVRFRDRLLHCVTATPSANTCRNLKDLMKIAVIDAVNDPVAELDDQLRAPFIQSVYRLDYDRMVVRELAIRLIECGGQASTTASCEIIRKLGPSQDLLDDATELARMLSINASPQALRKSLLWRQIQLLNNPSTDVCCTIRETLDPLRVRHMLHDAAAPSLASIRELVPVVKLTDDQIEQDITEALKHPLMRRRMRALEIAASFDLIDSFHHVLMDRFSHDHLEMKLKIVESLRYSSSIENRLWLEQHRKSPFGPIRDVAEESLGVLERTEKGG